jgi:XTP/dITP diphosphohydrolase
MRVYFASTNKHKFNEAKAILKEFGIALVWAKMELHEPESGTLMEVCRNKVEQAFAHLRKPVITEDTGIFFSAFDNFPGIRAKRSFQHLGYEGIFKKLKGKNKEAYFETVACYKDNITTRCFAGRLYGKIITEVRDREKDVLPYERIFVPAGYRCTLSAISRKEKNRISHRGKAFRTLGMWLANHVASTPKL